jgi:hypothetical protein
MACGLPINVGDMTCIRRWKASKKSVGVHTTTAPLRLEFEPMAPAVFKQYPQNQDTKPLAESDYSLIDLQMSVLASWGHGGDGLIVDKVGLNSSPVF